MQNSIKKYLEEHKQEMIGFLAELVAVPSVQVLPSEKNPNVHLK